MFDARRQARFDLREKTVQRRSASLSFNRNRSIQIIANKSNNVESRRDLPSCHSEPDSLNIPFKYPTLPSSLICHLLELPYISGGDISRILFQSLNLLFCAQLIIALVTLNDDQTHVVKGISFAHVLRH